VLRTDTANPERDPQAQQPQASAQPRYLHPKIFAVDLAPEDVQAIARGGYNVATATFGLPTRVVAKPGSFQYLRLNAKLHGYTEQEVIVVDLAAPEAVPAQLDDTPASREQSVWVKLDSGTIDPRPRAMIAVRDALDRIHSHGGVFILLAEHGWDTGYVSATQHGPYNGLEVHSDLPFDCWSLLGVLEHLGTKFDHGEELQPVAGQAAEAFALTRHLRDGHFTCTLHPDGILSQRWITLATSKYGDPVAGVIVPDDESQKGWVIILPRLAHPGTYVRELLADVLPMLAPRLFPHAEGTGWTRRQEYELPAVAHINSEINQVEQDAHARITMLQQRIERERAEHGHLQDLLTATGAELVAAVIATLKDLGFSDVRDIDAETEEEEKPLREDIQIWGRSPTLLVEVKGIAGLPKESATLQASKYVVPRMREWDRIDIQALSIVNHQRALPALEREQAKVFQPDVLANAEHQRFGLLTTWDLYRLARGRLLHDWSAEQTVPVLYRTGRIVPIPANYEPLGEVDAYWEQPGALALRLGEQPSRAGQAIAYELAVDFVQEQVTSLQLDGQDVIEVPPGSHVGVKTTLTKAQARKGTRVYLLTNATGSKPRG
jgi:hypothetical protein